MKRICVLCLVLLLTVSFVFATGNSEASNSETAGLKIAVVAGPSGVDDGGFDENIYDGALAFAANHPDATVTALTGDVNEAITLVSDVVADYDVEVCCGYQFASITQIAKDNPDTDFILVDTFPTDNEILPNIYSMMFAEQESGFFAGMIAALETETGKVAVLNGIAFPSNVNYQYGFNCGVIYANAKYDCNVEYVELASQAGTDVTGTNVGGNYVGSFNDEATAKVVTNQLIDKGVDIVFVAAGGSGNGALSAVKESKKKCKVIGCDVDIWDDGANGDSNIVLSSVLKNMAINVERVLNDINDGTFEGANELLTATSDSTGFVKAEGRQQLSLDTIEKLDASYELVKNKTIVPASNFGGFTPDEFKVE
ncbi:MAG: BMP family ABC transporter substrate-binding protein [Sphaerochaetaceae bacterium]|nr:BMP family ABC transporter substrate-binding protein [Sphaerochaetaceae bacterium]